MKQLYTLAQIQQIIKTDAVKYARLETESGELVYGFNTSGKDRDIAPHIKKICNALKNSRTLADGIYHVICTNVLGAANTQRTILPYKKGTGVTVAPEKIVYEAKPIKQDAPKELISYDALLKLHQELAEKNFTIKALEAEKREQAEYIVELESDLITQDSETLDAPGELSPGQQAINTLTSTGIKILDRLADKFLGEEPEKKELSDKSDNIPKISEAQIYKLLYNNPQLVNGFNEYIKQQLQDNGHEGNTEKSEAM